MALRDMSPSSESIFVQPSALELVASTEVLSSNSTPKDDNERISPRKTSKKSGSGHKKRRSDDTPKRPPNAFILYRASKQKEVAQYRSQRSTDSTAPETEFNCQTNMSKLIAEQWRNEDLQVKEMYYAQAAELSRDHRLKYPQYKYQPKRRTVETEAAPVSSSPPAEHTFTSDTAIDPALLVESKDLLSANKNVARGRRRASAEQAKAQAAPYPSSAQRESSVEAAHRRAKSQESCSQIDQVSTSTLALKRSQSYKAPLSPRRRHRKTGSLDAGPSSAQSLFPTLMSTETPTMSLPVGIAVSIDFSADLTQGREKTAQEVPRVLHPSRRLFLENSLASRGAVPSTLPLSPRGTDSTQIESGFCDPWSRDASTLPKPVYDYIVMQDGPMHLVTDAAALTEQAATHDQVGTYPRLYNFPSWDISQPAGNGPDWVPSQATTPTPYAVPQWTYSAESSADLSLAEPIALCGINDQPPPAFVGTDLVMPTSSTESDYLEAHMALQDILSQMAQQPPTSAGGEHPYLDCPDLEARCPFAPTGKPDGAGCHSRSNLFSHTPSDQYLVLTPPQTAQSLPLNVSGEFSPVSPLTNFSRPFHSNTGHQPCSSWASAVPTPQAASLSGYQAGEAQHSSMSPTKSVGFVDWSSSQLCNDKHLRRK